MPDIIYYAALCLLVLAGITCLVRFVFYVVLTVRTGAKPWVIVRLEDDNCELQLRGALEQCHWLGSACGGVLAVDCGLSDEGRTVCERMRKTHPGVKVCSPDTLEEVIRQELV